MDDVELGDIGVIAGRKGTFCVCYGAKLPDNVIACNAPARAASETSEALTMTDGTICWADEFVRLDFASKQQLIDAGILVLKHG